MCNGGDGIQETQPQAEETALLLLGGCLLPGSQSTLSPKCPHPRALCVGALGASIRLHCGCSQHVDRGPSGLQGRLPGTSPSCKDPGGAGAGADP